MVLDEDAMLVGHVLPVDGHVLEDLVTLRARWRGLEVNKNNVFINFEFFLFYMRYFYSKNCQTYFFESGGHI